MDRRAISGGEGLAGLLRAGDAGSDTAAGHVTVLGQALGSLPVGYRPGDPGAPKILIRSDSAGATHAFAAACRDHGVGFSFDYPVNVGVQDAVDTLNRGNAWYPAIASGGDLRDGAWVAEATGLVNLSRWPTRTRLILGKKRPHPGAQLRFTDTDSMRVTAFIADTPPGVIAGQLAGLKLRHRQHPHVEDRIRENKTAGLANFPCHSFDANAAWLEIVSTANDLVAWTKRIGPTNHPAIACREINTFRYRVPHVTARITHSARQLRLRIDATWPVGHNDHNRPATHPRRLPLTHDPPHPNNQKRPRPQENPPTSTTRGNQTRHIPENPTKQTNQRPPHNPHRPP